MSQPVPDLSAAPAPDAAAVAPIAPRPRGPLSLVILALLACGYTLWVAQAVILPVLLAAFLALVGNPLIRGLQKLAVPRFLGAALVLILGLAASAALAYQLVPPAAAWAKAAPRELRQLAPKLHALTRPVYEANQAAENFARAAAGDTGRRPQIMRAASDPFRTLTATPRMVASVLAVVLLTFFFMVYGASLQRHAIALLPRRQQQKLTFGILQSIERSVSRYVLTISSINVLVGLLFAGALFLLAFPLADALLWGTLVALLNFAPFVGPLMGVLMMLVVGLTAFDDGFKSLLPAAIYLGLHTLEGQVVTPIVLGRQMRLSPLILILALMVFGSLWGIVGLLLAVPMLVCIKLILAQVQGMEGWARLME